MGVGLKIFCACRTGRRFKGKLGISSKDVISSTWAFCFSDCFWYIAFKSSKNNGDDGALTALLEVEYADRDEITFNLR